MRLLLIVGLGVLLFGCAAMNMAPPNRWVNNNTLYSDKLPRLEIRVSKTLPFQKTKESEKLITSKRGSSHTGKNISRYYFKGDGAWLKIKISSLPTSSNNWFMIPHDYSKEKGNIISGDKKIHGMRFATGTMAVVNNGKPSIFKAYGRIVGGTTSYQIFYSERLEKEWENYDRSLLTRSDQDYLTAFNERADKSFSIYDYSPKKQ